MIKIFAAGIAALAVGASAHAAPMPAKDMVPGAADHPLLSRYAGSRLVAYRVKAFDETDLIAGKLVKGSGASASFEKSIHLEGKITRIAYAYPEDRSGLEVMRNYRRAMQAAGMVVEFSCDLRTCDTKDGSEFGGAIEDLKVSDKLEKWSEYNFMSPFNYGRVEPRYTLASLKRPDGSVTYAAVYVVPPIQSQLGGVLLEIVEPEAMETGKVSVNLTAGDMAKAIGAEGKVALYGVYFDTDQAELRADSKPSLDEIAKLLMQNPKLNVFVVGHTDNQGSYAHNLELSQKRSESIVRALITTYKIPPARLVAKGVASVAPVASNDLEPGRAKNRRVELVKQ